MRMREAVRPHAPTVVAFVAMLTVAAVFGAALAPAATVRPPGSVLPLDPIRLPGPGEDADGDTYADDVDVWDGNLAVRLVVESFDAPAAARQVTFLVGTQDDQWRTGEDAELAWRHVVDHDALGNEPGSPAWYRDAIRTGTWLRRVLDAEDGVQGLPLVFHLDVRDDRPVVRLDVEAYDPGRSPDRPLGRWALELNTTDGRWRSHASHAREGSILDLGQVVLRLERTTTLSPQEQESIALRWAPVLRFDGDEAFHPVPGDALQRFHGFYRREPDLRTWDPGFNNGRDGYRLLLADFDGDRRVDHRDARVMTDVLQAGPVAPPTVYAQVLRTTGDEVVVQFWFLYFYNFVSDDAGRDIQSLAHDGDREFVQLRFADLDAARSGTPESVAFSQHYRGVVVPYEARRPPFHVEPDRPTVFVAAGSHASYPAAGDDDALRPGFVGYGDDFDGTGAVLGPDDYVLEVLHDQPWHMGHLWGPLTRHARDLGTSTKPLLQHHFTYPFVDPLDWEARLPVVPAREVEELYGSKEAS